MQGYCVIDNYLVKDRQVILGGWSYFDKDKKRIPPQEIRLSGIQPYKIEFHSRSDLSAEKNTFGFRLHFEDHTPLLSLVEGISTCFAIYDEFQATASIWKKIYGKIYVDALCAKVQSFDADVKEHLLMKATRLLDNREDSLGTETQLLQVETGFAPYDKSVILGKDGHAFLFSGSNNLNHQYFIKPNPRLIQNWIEIIKSRHQISESYGAKFLQIIIPEKQSVLAPFYPLKIDVPTSTLKAINNYFHESDYYINLYDIFLKEFESLGVSSYRKMDSHLSFSGAKLATNTICEKLTGNAPRISEPELEEILLEGDLGSKFGWGNAMECALLPNADWDFANITPMLTHKFNPLDGNTGSLRYWETPKAQYDGSILIFGNSIFERGARSFGLSWWISRLFRQTYFVWGSTLEVDLIEKLKPDFVVTQTVERFLPSLPNR